MVGGYLQIVFLVLTTSSLVSCDCPRIQSTGICAFSIVCIGNITDISLPDECRGSVNHPVSVDLTVHDARDEFNNVDTEFVNAVTKFKAIAMWPTTNLSFLEHMPKLTTLLLSDSQIETIDGSPFFNLKYLQHLDLSRNYLTDIEDLFLFEDQPNKLEKLFLSYNHIEVIPGDAFLDLKSLKELDLSYNRIYNLDEEPFNNLTNLETLRLNGNYIKDLNGAINKLEHLKHLYLRDNQIQITDCNILKHLETFDVSRNNLEQLGPNVLMRHWDHIEGVCKIIVSGNKLKTVPESLPPKEHLARRPRETENKVELLTEVDLSKNHIDNIEYNAFRSIVKMTTLDLSCNNLTSFVVNPETIRDIRFLNLSTNFIANVYYASFSPMVNLQNLDLSHNGLQYISNQTFTNNNNLKYVNLTFNEMSIVKSLQIRMFHFAGGVLDLSNNGLSSLVIPYGEALRLTVLVLNSNQIANAADIILNYQNELNILELKNNSIQKLDNSSLMLPFNLHYLDLSYNQIDDIGPSTFYRVPHLKSLYLAHNELKELQYGAFRGLTALLSLDLSFNNIHYLDSMLLMDLKSLQVLSLKSNGLTYLDYNTWLNHKYDLKVYLDDNEYSCEWLGKALSDFNNGYSKMRPTVLQFQRNSPENSLEGIPCVQETKTIGTLAEKSSRLVSNYVLADERLLATNQKILEAVKDQAFLLRSIVSQFQHLNSLQESSNINCGLNGSSRKEIKFKFNCLNDVLH